MSLSNLPPSGELGAWRVMESSPVDLASVEYLVSNASIADAWKKVMSEEIGLISLHTLWCKIHHPATAR